MPSNLISTSNGSPTGYYDELSNEPASIHSGLINEIHDIPMNEITCPIVCILDENKVQSIIGTIQAIGRDHVPPIDILWYEAPSSGNNYFFCMGGRHRWEAHQRLNLPTIRAKLVRTTLSDLKIYFGSSLQNLQ